MTAARLQVVFVKCAFCEDVTWEGAGWGGCGNSDGNTHTATAAVFTTAAAAAGMTAATAPTAEHTLQITHTSHTCLMLYTYCHPKTPTQTTQQKKHTRSQTYKL